MISTTKIKGFFLFLLMLSTLICLSISSPSKNAIAQSSVKLQRGAAYNLPLRKDVAVLPGSQLTAVWANDGSDKVTREELRAARGLNVNNSVWNGSVIKQFGARNEIVSFNVVLEAALGPARNVSISFNKLIGPKNAKIASKKASKEDVFNYVGRNIEVFLVKYLQIKGLSRLGYEPSYDERHVPLNLQLPYALPKGRSSGTFAERPGAFKFYPDIALPIEAIETFDISAGENQSIWVDIYIPKKAPAGLYRGTLTIFESSKKTVELPVELEVLSFELPDVPSAKTMVFFSDSDINYRYTGVRYDDSRAATEEKRKSMLKAWNLHHLMAHRHRISLVNDGLGPLNKSHRRMQKWFPVLKGDLFTAANGYEGPGVGVSSGIYSIGTYGAWRTLWARDSEEAMHANTDKWVLWFEQNFPGVEYFLYLLDEPKAKDFPLVEQWASWVKSNPGPGKRMKTLVTTNLVKQSQFMPSVDIGFVLWGDTAVWKPLMEKYMKEGKKYWSYNGWRIAGGSFMIEDEGISLRVLGWTHYKHKVDRWFYWQSTQYKSGSRVNYETNVFEQAQTFGRKNDAIHPKFGETGSGYANGDGVLFYPGTDTHFPSSSYGLPGPIASLRLKLWRRGLQDVDYLTLAAQKDPRAVDALVQKMIPKTLWEVGVTNPKDPTYVHTDISWSVNPDDWERVRRRLAEIIMSRHLTNHP